MIMWREELEQQEAERLAPYAMKCRDSRGRAYPEDEHAYRTAYQRDRDRIIHTTAFRRLEYKTQVFIITEGDYYRTRLTHTIEVAQIGRTIARALRANEDLTEAICLAHDLGHGPFGHSGEGTLNELMADHGGFDHNHQSLRIVEKLERRFPDFYGLNLSWEVREGIMKHESEYDRGLAIAYDPDKRGTLECQIVNAADEIAYSTADLDDGLRSGMITSNQLEAADLSLWREVTHELGISPGTSFSEMDRHRVIRRLVGKHVTDLVQATDEMLQASNVQSVDDIRSLPSNVVTHSEAMQAKSRELKDFLYKNLYRHWRVMRMASKARRFLTQLVHLYVADPMLLPWETQARLESEMLQRVVCDYVAGMTDRYALQEYQKLFDPMEKV
ncbi:MAG: deoxyguanosinetriphosphate triphosphohydrolase [Anaerolineae bacterium]|jgi:dGTPase